MESGEETDETTKIHNDGQLSLDKKKNDDKNVSLNICGITRSINHNVLLDLILSVSYSFTGSLANDAVYTAYFFHIFQSNIQVGKMEAIYSLAELAAAIPIGFLADTWGRSKVIRWGSGLFIVTAGIHTAIMYWVGDGSTFLKEGDEWKSFWSLATVMAVWGVGDGIVSGPCEALLADSTTPPERTYYFHLQFVFSLTASMVGPLCALLFFRTSGNSWDIASLQTVMYMGLGMEVVNAWIMMYFDDSKALDDEDEDDSSDDSSNDIEDETDSLRTKSEEEYPLLLEQEQEPQIKDSTSLNPPDYGSIADNNCPEHNSRNFPSPTWNVSMFCCPTHHCSNDRFAAYRYLVPYILCTGDFVESIGVGLVAPFFPLFFKDTCGMSPGRVQVIYAIIPFGKVALSTLPPMLVTTWGRLETILAFWFVSILLFFTIPAFQPFYQEHHGLLIVVYIAKASFGGSIAPIEESLLIDSVPKSQRARWLSFDSVVSLAGTGAAIIGGYSVDEWGYRTGFFMSFAIQMVAWGLYTLLLLLVPSTPRKTTK